MAHLTLTFRVQVPWWLMPAARLAIMLRALGLLPPFERDDLVAFLKRHVRIVVAR